MCIETKLLYENLSCIQKYADFKCREYAKQHENHHTSMNEREPN